VSAPRKVLVTLGYSGWGRRPARRRDGPQQLDQRQRRPEIIFDTPVEQRYDKALSRWHRRPQCVAGGGARMMSGSSLHATPPPFLSSLRLRHLRVGVATGNTLTRSAQPCDDRGTGRRALRTPSPSDRRVQPERWCGHSLPPRRRAHDNTSARGASPANCTAASASRLHEVDERYTTTEPRNGRGRRDAASRAIILEQFRRTLK
jgi:hypothetical protein